MKICKYCKESILEEATKCPKCQSFQNKFRSPGFASLLSLLIIPIALIPMFMFNRKEQVKFMDYKDKITMDIIRKDTLKRSECKDCDILNIIVELNNGTAVEWEQGEFEVEFKTANGEVLNIEKRADFQLRLHPNSTTKSAIKIPIYKEYDHSAIEIKLVNLRHNKWY